MLKLSKASLGRPGSKERLLRVRSGSKDSDSTTTLSASPDGTVVRMGKCTKQGQEHLNEDRLVCLDSLAELLDEDVMEMSQVLDMVATDKGAGKTFLETVMMACVFDGHGGSACAEYVSTHLQAHLAKLLDKNKISDMDKASTAMLQAWDMIESDFCKEANVNDDTSGSCAVAALVWGKEVLVAHCGDCRAVVRTADGETTQLTKDHRATDPAELVRIETAGGEVIDGRVSGVLAPSRSFGDVDVKDRPGVVIAEPDVTKYVVRPYHSSTRKYTFMIMASDGVWDVMSNEAACDYVGKILTKHHGNADLAAHKLVSMCSKYNLDDVTAVVVVWQTPLSSSPGREAASPLHSPLSPEPKSIGRRAIPSMGKKEGAELVAQAGIEHPFAAAAASAAVARASRSDSGGYESSDDVHPELLKKGLKSIFSQAKLVRGKQGKGGGT